MRRLLASLMAVVLFGSWASAQTEVKYRWQTGQVLTYRVDHVTDASDVVADSRSDTKSVLRVTKRWQVIGVDTAGVATLQLSLTSMSQERTTPSGEVIRFDSADPDKSTPQLREAMSRFLNTPLATIRVDATGRVVEVKESKSDASSYENELPFLVLLPVGGMKPGAGWERAFKITLAPPLGTGEKYEAVQKYTCKAVTDTAATVQFTTDLVTAPKAPADAVPLWQMMPQGEVVIDVKNGRLHSARLTITKDLANHQGENSSCKFSSTLTVQYLGDR
ncbi:MAG: hypothetical protein U0736_07505 [Gemmataceae bacterium]